jgi:predicted dehydrogenase
VLLDIGVHLLDLAFYTLGDFEVECVSGAVQSVYGHQGLGYGTWGKSSPLSLAFDVEDTANARIRMRSGAIIHLDLAWAAPLENGDILSLELTGERGAAKWKTKEFIAGPGHESCTLPDATPLAANRYAHFIDLIHQRVQPVVTLDQALKVQAVLDAIYESARQGREVVLAPA